jgi:hypothetical protein
VDARPFLSTIFSPFFFAVFVTFFLWFSPSISSQLISLQFISDDAELEIRNWEPLGLAAGGSVEQRVPIDAVVN